MFATTSTPQVGMYETAEMLAEAEQERKFLRLFSSALWQKWQILRVPLMRKTLQPHLSRKSMAYCFHAKISNEEALHRLRQEILWNSNYALYDAVAAYCKHRVEALTELLQCMEKASRERPLHSLGAFTAAPDAAALTQAQFEVLLKAETLTKLHSAVDIISIERELKSFLPEEDCQEIFNSPDPHQAVAVLHKKLFTSNSQWLVEKLVDLWREQREEFAHCLECMMQPVSSLQVENVAFPSVQCADLLPLLRSIFDQFISDLKDSSETHACPETIMQSIRTLQHTVMEQCRHNFFQMDAYVRSFNPEIAAQQFVHHDALTQLMQMMKQNKVSTRRLAALGAELEEKKGKIEQLEQENNRIPFLVHFQKLSETSENQRQMVTDILQKRNSDYESAVGKIQKLTKENRELETSQEAISCKMRELEAQAAETKKQLEIMQYKYEERILCLEKEKNQLSRLLNLPFKIWPSNKVIRAVHSFQMKGLTPVISDQAGNYESIDWYTLGGDCDWRRHWENIVHETLHHPLYFPPMILPLEYGECAIWLNLTWMENKLVIRGRICDAEPWLQSPNSTHVELQIILKINNTIMADIRNCFCFTKAESLLLTVCKQIKPTWPMPEAQVKVFPRVEH